MNPDAAEFTWNTSVDDFVPGGGFSFSSPVSQPTPRKTIHPASYSYNPPQGIQAVLNQDAYFYYWRDEQIYLQDGAGVIFGPFSELDNFHFYQLYVTQNAEEQPAPTKQDNCISFSDFMKTQEKTIKSSGPKFGFVEVTIHGHEKKAVVEEEVTLEEEKAEVKVKEKPKIKFSVEKAVDKLALLAKVRETSDSSNQKSIDPDEALAPVNIVFIGHVDAGKSTICGNILLLTNKIDKRLIEAYEQEAKEKGRESWWLAYVMDQNEEERAKGKTVEVGRAFFETSTKRFTILDAPGHKAYVPNMISGASQAEYAALVISARTGEFETGFERGGQTREHAMLAKSFGVTKLIVIINKMDDPSVMWNQERYEQIKRDMCPYLQDSCHYDLSKDIDWVPISGLSGENIMKHVGETAPWYTGPTLFQIFDSMPLPVRSPEEALRIPIIDRIKDQGLTAYGKIESGQVIKGLRVFLMPIRAKGEILEITGGEDTRLNYSNPGENVKIRIKVPEEVDVQRGYVICDVHSVCHTGFEFKADVQFLDLPDSKMLVTAGYKCVMHLHTAIEECEVQEVIAVFDPEKQKKVKRAFVRSNQRVLLKIRSFNEICMEKFTAVPQLGRFVLRDKGLTVALGKIYDVCEDPSLKVDN
jgi:peptide chain release factor subunit 3